MKVFISIKYKSLATLENSRNLKYIKVSKYRLKCNNYVYLCKDYVTCKVLPSGCLLKCIFL